MKFTEVYLGYVRVDDFRKNPAKRTGNQNGYFEQRGHSKTQAPLGVSGHLSASSFGMACSASFTYLSDDSTRRCSGSRRDWRRRASNPNPQTDRVSRPFPAAGRRETSCRKYAWGFREGMRREAFLSDVLVGCDDMTSPKGVCLSISGGVRRFPISANCPERGPPGVCETTTTVRPSSEASPLRQRILRARSSGGHHLASS